MVVSNGAGGAKRIVRTRVSSRGAEAVTFRYSSRTSRARAAGHAMRPPTIFGHNTGSNDVTADLQGGNPVG